MPNLWHLKQKPAQLAPVSPTNFTFQNQGRVLGQGQVKGQKLRFHIFGPGVG